MKVSEVMTRDVKVCLPTEPLTRAAQIMWEQDCGCVPVLSANGKPVGMITDRDVCMAAYTRGSRLDEVPVERAMSCNVFSCRETDELKTPHELMRTHRVRRLPVVGADGKIVGLLSLADLLRAAKQEPKSSRASWDEQLTTTLCEIAQTHCALPATTKTQTPMAAPTAKPGKLAKQGSAT